VVDEAVARARPEVSVTGTVVDGPVVPTLRRLSERARLVVLGERGLGGFTGLLAGSVAVGVATNAVCPVVVARGTAAPTDPIVVGLDDAADADHALGFAFDQAAARGVELAVVRAWQPPPLPWRNDIRPLAYDVDELEAAERWLAREALPAWQRKYPDVVARIRLMPGSAAHALVAASADAQLVVVGSRGQGGFHGLLLGSVARQVIHHAHCPVAVVRDLTTIERH
jgi:nucleotide-binding universal stress UspA family protein